MVNEGEKDKFISFVFKLSVFEVWTKQGIWGHRLISYIDQYFSHHFSEILFAKHQLPMKIIIRPSCIPSLYTALPHAELKKGSSVQVQDVKNGYLVSGLQCPTLGHSDLVSGGKAPTATSATCCIHTFIAHGHEIISKQTVKRVPVLFAVRCKGVYL